MIKLLHNNIFLPLTKLLNVHKAAKTSKKDLLISNNKLIESRSTKYQKSSSIEEINNLHKVIHSKMNDQMLGRKEAAEFLGVKEGTLAIWKSTNRQIIPTYKVGKYIKYRASDLQKFLDEKLI